jgi:hypothetical protein
MAGSLLSNVLELPVPGFELGQRAFGTLRSAAGDTASFVAGIGTDVTRRAADAATCVSTNVNRGLGAAGAAAADSLLLVSDAVKSLRCATVTAVEGAMSAGLEQLGVPTRGDLTALQQRMDRITIMVERLQADAEALATPRKPRPRKTR